MNQSTIAPSEGYHAKWPRFVWIDKRHLMIDPRYQRNIESRRSQTIITHIRENFDPKQCTPLLVTDNADGTWCVVDGQHRWAAAMDVGWVTDLPCWDLGEMTLQQQAQTFVDINLNRVTVNPLAVHHAKVRAGDAMAKAIDEVVAAAGCRIHKSPTPNNQTKPGDIQALTAIRNAIESYGRKVVIETLTALRKAWPDGHGIDATLFRACVQIAALNKHTYTLERQFKTLRPEVIAARAHAMQAENPTVPMVQHYIKILVGRHAAN